MRARFPEHCHDAIRGCGRLGRTDQIRLRGEPRRSGIKAVFAALGLALLAACGRPAPVAAPEVRATLAGSLAAHAHRVADVAFFPDGTHFASASADGTVKV